MRRAVAALIIGGVLVCALFFLGHHAIGTPIPFLFLAPGIMAGACVPGSGFNPEGDVHPWSVASVIVAYGTNVLIYSALAYLCLFLTNRVQRDAK
jgi:hypothetical protein